MYEELVAKKKSVATATREAQVCVMHEQSCGFMYEE